ncbi:MAG: ATP synthase F1 subunit gamma, partial [Balneolaceae bacterium]
MANLRDIRNRISSVNNTKQITKAMKMVAAARLRKAQQRMVETRPYATKMREVVARLVSGVEMSSELLRVPEERDRILFIVIGSDRGLCGGFNNNLFKVVESALRSDFGSFLDSDTLDLVCIGKKADAYFKKRNYNVVRSYPGFFDDLHYSNAVGIMENAMDEFTEETYDEVHVAYNEFKSIITQRRMVKQLLPVDSDLLTGELKPEEDDSVGVIDYIYEPDAEGILEQLLPLHLNVQLWSALLESNASEQGARMAAMDNATENAKELEDEFRIEKNQTPQSAIT